MEVLAEGRALSLPQAVEVYQAATTTSYTYDVAERMTAAGATTFAYDKNGNQTSRTNGTTTTAYAYDFEDELVNAGTKTYARDPLGAWPPRRWAPRRPTTSSMGRRSSRRRSAPPRLPTTPAGSATP